MIVAIEKQVGEVFDAESCLMGMMTAADRACAHGEAAGLYASLAEGHSVCGAERARESGKGERTLRKGDRMDPGGTGGPSGTMNKIAAFHAASPCCGVSGANLPPNGRTKLALGYRAPC